LVGGKVAQRIIIFLAIVANGLAFAIAVLLGNIWFMLLAVGIVAFVVYAFYVRFVLKRKLRYPLIPPEGKQDIYLPRTNIPRPVIEDFRRIEEKKRRLAKLNKMLRRKGRRKS